MSQRASQWGSVLRTHYPQWKASSTRTGRVNTLRVKTLKGDKISLRPGAMAMSDRRAS